MALEWRPGIIRERDRAELEATRRMDGSTNHFFLLAFLPVFLIGCSQVKILKPATGSAFISGQRVEFEGEITRSFETGEADLSDELFWSSSIDGQLGTGRIVTTDTLSVGSHGITASWPYHTRSDNISIRVNP